MQQVEIQTAQNVALQYEIAGVGDRIVATLIDWLIVGTYFILAAMAFVAVFVDSVMADDLLLPFFFVVVFAPAFFYHLLCEVFLGGQSLGKKARKIRVMRLDGREPTFGNYLLRWVLRIVDIGFSNGLVGLISIIATRNAQRLGDLAAGTTVVSIAKRRDLRETIFTQTYEDYQIHFPQVDRLSEEDIALTKSVYDLLVSDGRTPRARTAGDDLKRGLESRLGTTTDLAPLDLARTVLRDYNHLHGVVD